MIMKKIFKTLFIIVLAILVCACGQARKVSAQTKYVENHSDDSTEDFSASLIFPAKRNSCYTLKKDIDLGGNTYKMPEGVTIKGKKGVIKNGTLIGSDTKIEGILPVFDKVTIKGDWIVHDISTKMFKDLDYDNSLRDVMALTSVSVKNNVEILEGIYYIKLVRNQETGIYIRSNTTVVLYGEIHLRPNDFTNYHVVELIGNNCSLDGKGLIIGDKSTHTGTTGEWGMGVDFARAENASISGITIKDCWGDCIYVGDESKNVTIDNCILNNGRRQGISITEASDIQIKNSKIYNIGGVEPGFAIDVETNKGTHVSNVRIYGVVMHNCKGGIQVNGHAPNSSVSDVTASYCTMYDMTGPWNIVCYNSINIAFKNNYLDKAEKACVKFQNCQNYRIEKSRKYMKN